MLKKRIIYELLFQEPIIENIAQDSAYWKVHYVPQRTTFPARNAADARKKADILMSSHIVTLPLGQKYFRKEAVLATMRIIPYQCKYRSSAS